MKKKNHQQGMIKLFVLFVLFCMAVWYFKFDVRGFVDSHSEVQKFFISTTNYLGTLWNNYVLPSWSFITNKVVSDVIWERGLQPVAHLTAAYVPKI